MKGWRERWIWIACILVLFGIFFACVFINVREHFENVDDLVVSYNYYVEPKNGEKPFDINDMSKKEVEDHIPVLISEYETCPAHDIQACERAGLRVALAYLKIHNRDKTKEWLKNLIQKFSSDPTYVAQCQKILKQID